MYLSSTLEFVIKILIEYKGKPFDQPRKLLTRFTPDFELIPGTKSKANTSAPKIDPMQVDNPSETNGG